MDFLKETFHQLSAKKIFLKFKCSYFRKNSQHRTKKIETKNKTTKLSPLVSCVKIRCRRRHCFTFAAVQFFIVLFFLFSHKKILQPR